MIKFLNEKNVTPPILAGKYHEFLNIWNILIFRLHACPYHPLILTLFCLSAMIIVHHADKEDLVFTIPKHLLDHLTVIYGNHFD